MLSDFGNHDTQSQFREGNRGLLLLMGHRFLFTVLNATPDTVRITFPVQDFPMEGMYVTLEFHDELGFSTFESEVITAPSAPGDGLLVRRPPEGVRTHHRSNWRVAADFHVGIKGHVHPRRHDAPVINISGGGLLVRSDAPLNFGDNVDLDFTLPGDGAKQALAQVMHVNVSDKSQGGIPLIGLKFVGTDPQLSKSITMYMWRRLRELHPRELRQLRRASDQV